MPFTPYKSAFDADTLQVLQEAYDMALADVLASADGSVDEQRVRNMLARRIIDAWRDKGERDPDRLKAYVLEGFAP
jgi:hypothetical protein